MTPAERIQGFLQLAGIERPVERTISAPKGGKLTVLVHLDESERTAAFRAAAARAELLHQEAEEARDLTIASAKLAIARAIAIGEFLLQMSALFSGDFDEWLEGYCAEKISRRTAYRYMKATRYKDALGDECPDFATLKELYVAAGIMPPPEPGDGRGTPPAPPIFRLRFDVNGPPPEEWESIVRLDFLEKAKPIVEIYERAMAAEANA